MMTEFLFLGEPSLVCFLGLSDKRVQNLTKRDVGHSIVKDTRPCYAKSSSLLFGHPVLLTLEYNHTQKYFLGRRQVCNNPSSVR